MKRLLVLLAFAVSAAHAQVQTTAVSPVIEVQRLAPQLVGFAGSDLNFANLVNGLALGVPVTLTTPLTVGGNTGGMQVFTFTPAGGLSSVQIAQILETARQSLIARGIATPTAQQLGTTLVGGSLATAMGMMPVNGLINTATSPAAAIQSASSPAANAAASGNTTPRFTSDSLLPRGVSDTPPLPTPGVAQPAQSTPATPATPMTAAPAAPSGPQQMR